MFKKGGGWTPCQNPGKCGVVQHRKGSQESQNCLKSSSSSARSQPMTAAQSNQAKAFPMPSRRTPPEGAVGKLPGRAAPRRPVR